MAVLVPDTALQCMLEMVLNKRRPENLLLRLYTNNKVPTRADTTEQYIEATFQGYSSVVLVGAQWAVVPGRPTAAASVEQKFLSTAGQPAQSCYGYYVTQISSGTLMWAERFSAVNAPFVMQNNGDEIVLDMLQLTLGGGMS